MKFSEMKLSNGVAKALEEMKLEEAFLIQTTTIPPIMEGKDVIGKAESGSGKTLAFAIPIAEKINYSKNIQALVITPTRELAVQVSREINKVSKYMKARSMTVYGGVSIIMQARRFSQSNVVVATPGRLMDHIRRNNIDLRHVSMLVLDEADRMLDMGFIDDIKFILRFVPKERQTLLFSATFSEEIRKIANNYMKNPVLIELNKEKPSVKTVKQSACIVKENEKQRCLEFILNHEKPELALIFCSTKIKSDRLHRNLSRYYKIEVIHGDLSQQQRERVLEDFKNKRVSYLIATDVAARGIDVKNISHVINYDMPNDIETYIHRIGRTGRAGASGKSITFVKPEEISDLLRIEHFVKVKIEKQKFINGKFVSTNPEDFSLRNVIIPKWSRKDRFKRSFGERRPMHRKFGRRRYR
jgi:ATP-dependent RNA helicase DeaD